MDPFELFCLTRKCLLCRTFSLKNFFSIGKLGFPNCCFYESWRSVSQLTVLSLSFFLPCKLLKTVTKQFYWWECWGKSASCSNQVNPHAVADVGQHMRASLILIVILFLVCFFSEVNLRCYPSALSLHTFHRSAAWSSPLVLSARAFLLPPAGVCRRRKCTFALFRTLHPHHH